MAKKKVANKRHRMTKLEKFYIDHHLDKDAKSLAIELGIPEAVIDRYQKKVKRENKKEEQEEENSPKPPTTDDFMIKNKEYGVVVMTPEASQQGDHTKQTTLKSKYYNNAVKKIR